LPITSSKVGDCFLINLLCEQYINLYKSHILYSDKEYKPVDSGHIRAREVIRSEKYNIIVYVILVILPINSILFILLYK
jgi:hypothetical protein